MNTEQKSAEAPKFIIFVYGTLKRGHGNFHLLDRGRGKFLGEATTLPEFTMFSLGGFPGIIRVGDTPIKGELFEVGPAVLADLDRLEGHPGFYRREDIRLENGDVVQGYVLPVHDRYVQGCPVVVGGEWLRGLSSRS